MPIGIQSFASLTDDDLADDFIGGVLRDGKFAWIAAGAHLEVFSIKAGNKVSTYSFDTSQRLTNTVITCVTEVQIEGINSCVLLVGVQCSPLGGLLYIFSVQGSRVIHRIDVVDRITSCCFIPSAACKFSSLKRFDGCAAVGTEEGKILLLDLNLKKCRDSKWLMSCQPLPRRLMNAHFFSYSIPRNFQRGK